MEYNNQPIILAYFKDNLFKGFYSDSIGTVTQTEPKIFHCSLGEVSKLLMNIKSRISVIEANYTNIMHNPIAYMKDWQNFEVKFFLSPEQKIGDYYPSEEITKLETAIKNYNVSISPIEVFNFTINVPTTEKTS